MAAFNPRRYGELLQLIEQRIAKHAREFDTRLPLQVFLDRIHDDAELTAWDAERKQLEEERAMQ